MALSIKHPDADRLARKLAQLTGETLTQAIITALQERILRERGRSRARRLSEELRIIGERCSSLPVLDDRPPEEILGYNEHGLPR